jgi:hypothetical protein
MFDGMQSVRRTTFLTAAAALALAGSAAAQSHQIGLKIGQNGNGDQQGADPAAMLPADLAGAPGYAQTNWNVLGRYGNNDTNAISITTNLYALFDTGGDDTHVTVQWDATGLWSVANGGAPVNQGNPDGNLMNPYSDSNGNGNVNLTNGLPNGIFGQNNNNKPMIYLAGIQQWLATEGASQYDLVLYMDGDNQAGRTGEYWLQQASGPTTNLVFDPLAPPSGTPGIDITTHIFMRDYNNFPSNPTYQQVPFTSNNGRVAGAGNYAVFTGLNADSFVIRSAEFNSRCGINAIQLVPRATLLGPVLDPLPAARTYAGGTATFHINAAGVRPLTYQWQKNGLNLTDGGNISGSTGTNLVITGVSIADQGNYTVVVTSPNGSTTSTAASLTVVTLAVGSYAEEIVTNGPVAYWRFNDTEDPSTGFAPAVDSIGGHNAIYGPLAQDGFNGIVGPQSPAFPGFENGNAALQSSGVTVTPLPYPSKYVNWAVNTATPLNLNTNTVTFCAWIYPTAAVEPANCAFIFNRGGTDTSGFGYGGNNNLGYTWNNAGNTFGFVSGLVPASNQWSFVALVISPTNAIIYLYNTNGQFSATNTVAHTVGTWTNAVMLGDDPSSTGTPQNRAFTGSMDELAVFNHCLSDQDLYLMFKRGLNVGIIPAGIAIQPKSEALYVGRNAIFTVAASGDRPLSYQWRTNGVSLVNGGRISGATSPTLVVSNVNSGDAVTYDVFVDNIAHTPVTSSPATLTVVPLPSPMTAYEGALQAANPLYYWRFNEAAASPYAYDYWGGNIATNDGAASGSVGPIPPDFPGFETTNAANSYDGFSQATETFLTGVNNNQTNFTIAGWFNAAGAVGLRIGLFGQNDVTEFGFHGQDPALPTGEGLLGIWTPAGATYLSQTLITPNQWYFTAGVGDGSTVKLYLFTTNGTGGYQVAFSSATTTTNNYGSSAYNFNIGGDGVLDTTGNYFPGLLDEVALWHRALSAGELSTLFASAIGVTALPPQITAQPISQTLYAGRTATFSVTAIGSATISYQWRKNGAPLGNGGNISGALTATLTVSNVGAADQASYDVVINNSAGTATSTAATLSVISPVPGSYESGVIALNPIAYYRLNETTDPSTGTAVANDYWGGHPGTYGTASQNGFTGIEGPRPLPWEGFDANNYAVAMLSGTPSGCVTNPFGTLNTNMATFTMWIYPTATEDSFCGLETQRGGSNPGGFGYTGGHLGYTWNNNNGNTWGATWNPVPLVPPLNQWSFVALVVTPTNAITYMTDAANPANLLSATADVANVVESHGGAWEIGNDHDGATRTFSGSIDEVAIFSYSLTPSQLQQLYRFGYSGAPVTLTIQQSGANVVLTWGHGVLQSASDVQGPYTDVLGANSPYSTPAGGTQQFFRVRTR